MPTISELAAMKDGYRGYDDDRERVYDDRHLRTRARRTSRGNIFQPI